TFVGIGQRASRNVPAKSCVIQLRPQRPQTSRDVPQALPKGQLGERHRLKLIPTGKSSHAIVAAKAPDARVELVSWKELHQLRKDQPAGMHRSSFPSPTRGKDNHSSRPS